MTEILGCGGAMLPWVGVIGGVVYLKIRLGQGERPIIQASDAWELDRAGYARGEITAEEPDVLGLRLQV